MLARIDHERAADAKRARRAFGGACRPDADQGRQQNIGDGAAHAPVFNPDCFDDPETRPGTNRETPSCQCTGTVGRRQFNDPLNGPGWERLNCACGDAATVPWNRRCCEDSLFGRRNDVHDADSARFFRARRKAGSMAAVCALVSWNSTIPPRFAATRPQHELQLLPRRHRVPVARPQIGAEHHDAASLEPVEQGRPRRQSRENGRTASSVRARSGDRARCRPRRSRDRSRPRRRPAACG